MVLNLDPPPGFRGFDEERELRVYARNLPHWRQDGATYFVTFHLADALPASKRDELASLRRDWEARNQAPRDASAREYAKLVFAKIETWMDSGFGACWFRNDVYADELERTILHFHEIRYELGCFVIMPNHCHLVIRPLVNVSLSDSLTQPMYYELEDEIGSMKSLSARFVNRRENVCGKLWHEESYDRIVRDEGHLWRVVQYIGANPRRAGIPAAQWRRWINPTWQEYGWDFVR